MIVLTLCPPWSRDRLLAGRDLLLQLGYLVSAVLLVRHPRYALHYIGRQHAFDLADRCGNQGGSLVLSQYPLLFRRLDGEAYARLRAAGSPATMPNPAPEPPPSIVPPMPPTTRHTIAMMTTTQPRM